MDHENTRAEEMRREGPDAVQKLRDDDLDLVVGGIDLHDLVFRSDGQTPKKGTLVFRGRPGEAEISDLLFRRKPGEAQNQAGGDAALKKL